MRQPSNRRDSLPTIARHEGRVFDTIPSLDDASLQYPVRTFLSRAELAEPQRKTWRRGAVLDQGSEGACVGHGVVGELVSDPVRVDFSQAGTLRAEERDPDGAPKTAQEAAFWLYGRAQRIDEWPGEDYSGTSVNAGMKVARNQGLIDGWRWGATKDDMIDSLVNLGPVVIAIPWHDGMYEAPDGELIIGAGDYVGWHCLLLNGYDPSLRTDGTLKRDVGYDREMVRILNSWGTEWGTYGSAWAEADRLWSFLDENDGDMAIAFGRNLAYMGA